MWGCPTHPLPVIQVLRGGRAETWWVLEPEVPGYIRLGVEWARWAVTYDGTRDAPAAVLDYRSIPGNPDPDRIVVVVAHRHRADTVGVVARSRRVPLADGIARCPVTGATVVDLPSYRPPVGRAPVPTPEFEAVAAAALGQALLLDRIPAPARARITTLDACASDVPAKILGAFAELDTMANILAGRAAAAGVDGPPGP